MGECCEDQNARQVAREMIDELMIQAPELAYRRGGSRDVGAACAVLAGLTLLHRNASTRDVAAWLKWIVTELETTGELPELRQWPTSGSLADS